MTDTDVQAQMEKFAAVAQTGPEHERLKPFEGTWAAEVKMWFDPQGDPQVSTGTMTNAWILGGRFLEQRYEDDSGRFSGRGLWGYNTVDQRYEGLWVDSMATFMHVETGRYDEATKTFSMTSTMTDPMSGRKMNKRSEITVMSADQHVMRMYYAPAAGGQEVRNMEITYRRKT